MNDEFRILACLPPSSDKRWRFGLARYESSASQVGSFDGATVDVERSAKGDDWNLAWNLLLKVHRIEAMVSAHLSKGSEFNSFRNLLPLVWLPDTEKRSYGVFISVPRANQEGLTWDEAWAAYALVRALFLALAAQPADYEFATVFAAWQQYNLIKHIYCLAARQTPPRQNWLESEFGSSHRALVGLLQNPRYAVAFRTLWLAHLEGGAPDADSVGNRDQAKEDASKKTADADKILEGNRDPWIRERLRLSMVLGDRHPSSSKNRIKQPLDLVLLNAEVAPNEADVTPYEAPSCFLDRCHPHDYQLHPYFHKDRRERDRLGLEHLVRNELLPNYSLLDAFSVAVLMTNRGSRNPKKLWYILVGAAVLFFAGFAGTALALLPGAPAFMVPIWPIWFGCSVFSLLVMGFILLFYAGSSNAATLILPRAIGGILGGYFWLFVAAEPWYFALYAQRHALFFWPIEWFLALLAAGYYLYREAFARVTIFDVALARGMHVLVLTVLEALAIGSLLTWLARPICQRVLERDCDYLSLGVVPHWGFYYPIAALLTFAPLAILLGIVLQVLWLEHPITASVWQPDAR